MVALRKRPQLAGGGFFPYINGQPLSLLCRQESDPGGDGHRHEDAGTGKGMVHGAQRSLDAAGSLLRPGPQGLVALRKGSHLPGGNLFPRKGARHRLSVLQGTQSSRRIQRPCNCGTGDRRTMASDVEWGAYAPAGHPRKQKAGLVALQRESCLESRCLFPYTGKAQRLSCVCGKSKGQRFEGNRHSIFPEYTMSFRSGKHRKEKFRVGRRKAGDLIAANFIRLL